jgi:hypothetical protein
MKNGKHHPRVIARVEQVALSSPPKVTVTFSEETHQPDFQSGHRVAQVLLKPSVSSTRHNKITSPTHGRRRTPAESAGTAHPANSGNGGSMHRLQKCSIPMAIFRPLGEYDNTELRAVKFRSDNEADRALVLIGKSSVLKRMPFLFADGLTFIVPQDAIELLKMLKLHFKASRVLDMDDLDPKERSEIRRYQSL